MSSQDSHGSTPRLRGREQQRSDQIDQEETSQADGRAHSHPREVASSSKLLNYLLFKHGIELGVLGWISCIITILNTIWVIKAFSVTDTVSHAQLTQAALANQIGFLKMCLDYPQLGEENPNLKGWQLLFRDVPCKAFLKKLDFDAMARVLVDPQLVPDIKSPPQPIYPVTPDEPDESIVGILKEFYGTLFTSYAGKVMLAFTLFAASLATVIFPIFFLICWAIFWALERLEQIVNKKGTIEKGPNCPEQTFELAPPLPPHTTS